MKKDWLIGWERAEIKRKIKRKSKKARPPVIAYIDATPYPDCDPPAGLRDEGDAADYLMRVCGAGLAGPSCSMSARLGIQRPSKISAKAAARTRL